MPVVMDTGPLVGLVNPKDPHAARSRNIMAAVFEGRHGTAIVPDAVFIEALNFVRAKTQDVAVSRRLIRIMDRFVMANTEEPLLAAAADLHFQAWDRRLSLTDCVVIEHARRSRAVAATLDRHWDGLVSLVR